MVSCSSTRAVRGPRHATTRPHPRDSNVDRSLRWRRRWRRQLRDSDRRAGWAQRRCDRAAQPVAFMSRRQRRYRRAMSHADADADPGAVTQRDLSRLDRERREPLSFADRAPVVEPVAGLLHLQRRQLSGSVPVAHAVVLTRPDAKRLSDRHRRPKRTVPDPHAVPVSGPIAIAGMPDQHERSNAALSNPNALTQKKPASYPDPAERLTRVERGSCRVLSEAKRPKAILGRMDSNHRMADSKPAALPLGDAPSLRPTGSRRRPGSLAAANARGETPGRRSA